MSLSTTKPASFVPVDICPRLAESALLLGQRMARCRFLIQGSELELSEVFAVDGMLPLFVDHAVRLPGDDGWQPVHGLVLNKKALMETESVLPSHPADMFAEQRWLGRLRAVMDAMNQRSDRNGGVVELDADYESWFARVQGREFKVFTDHAAASKHYREVAEAGNFPLPDLSVDSSAAVSREEVADYLAAPVADAIRKRQEAMRRPGIFLVKPAFFDFDQSLVDAIVRALTREDEPAPLCFSGKDAAKRELDPIVDRIASGGNVVMVSSVPAKLPPALRELTEHTLVIERYTADGLEQAIGDLYELPARPVIADEPWVAHVRPTDLLVNAYRSGSLVADIRQTVERRLALVAVQDAMPLDQMHGVAEAREWAEQLIEDIRLAEKGPLKGGIRWADVDKGALFAGPPGVGKTTIARAIAKACGLKFVNASAAAWQAAGTLDEHLSAMQASFREATEYAPSILFIDEVDSIGSREGFQGQNKQYHTEVVNALLQELDGFEGRNRVIVLAATNYAQNVDPALRRPGRLDRVIQISKPNVPGLKGIYAYHLGKAGHVLPEADIAQLARASLGLTGADIELFVRSAQRQLRRQSRQSLVMDDLMRQVFRTPTESQRRPITAAELRAIAIHEAGHATLLMTSHSRCRTINYISIVPRNDGSLGFVASSDPERLSETNQDALYEVAVMLAGRAAEALVLGHDQISSGAGGNTDRCDLAQATQRCVYLLTKQGAGSSSGLMWRDADIERDATLRQQVDAMLAEQYKVAQEILGKHRPEFDRLVEILLEKQEITGVELRALFGMDESVALG